MKALIRIFSLIILVLAVGYLLLPTPPFPLKPPDSVQSLEDADTETSLRRAYFTNFTREEVMAYYEQQLVRSPFLGIQLPTYRLNYPPEDAFSVVRDQTRSTFLEEIVHPLRESLFINGFKPKEAKDEIWYKGIHFDQKITVRYSPSAIFIRLLLTFVAVVLLLFLIRELFISARVLLKLGFGGRK